MSGTTGFDLGKSYERALSRTSRNGHIDEVVDRVWPVLQMVEGTAKGWTKPRLRRELCNLIAVAREVQANPEQWGEFNLNQHLRFGPLCISVGMVEGENWEVLIKVAEVYGMQVYGADHSPEMWTGG